MTTTTTPVRLTTGPELLAAVDDLADLLVDAVAGGSSVGFLADLDHAGAAAWWAGRAPLVADGRGTVWLARDPVDGRALGTVSLVREAMPNGRHRAEVVKLMVRREARGRGTATALLAAAEAAAVAEGLTLLMLDTETGSPAERLYARRGWIRYGVVPGHATDPTGVPLPTTFFYKSLSAA
ncbi:GNAT family N-acetyltransferase [Streptomyces hainanensis]|uniref:GNAT family N-acetyltransferase n=1 Tax=Streptomyces hainanensis TaxID=402648 RepID=A0A4V2Y127_9ACTN|nr:GNAT family N-acetyltransferase [Streptomyces hainanensis]TDC67165.1 GNAT family N-acetyltransferase [Streptomyces hainanensis]